MASSSSQQRINRNSGFSPPQRSQSMYIPRSGLDEPEILKRRARSTRGGRARKSTLFSGRSTPKIPQIENSIDLFEKVLNALRYYICFEVLHLLHWCYWVNQLCIFRDCGENVKDNIRSSPITVSCIGNFSSACCVMGFQIIENDFKCFTRQNVHWSKS
jgi:hypothetical protein